MSRKNKHRVNAYVPGRVVSDIGQSAAATVPEVDDIPYRIAGSPVPSVERIREPYLAEEQSFLEYGDLINSSRLTEYLNAYAQEHNAELLHMFPTKRGSFLFVWDMT